MIAIQIGAGASESASSPPTKKNCPLERREGLIAAVVDTSRAKDLREYVLHPVEVTNDKRNVAEPFHHG